VHLMLQALPQFSSGAREVIHEWKEAHPPQSDDRRPVFHPDGEGRAISSGEGIRGSSERGPPENRQGSGLLFTRAKGDAAEPRGRDEVESLPARVRAHVQDQAERVRESRELADGIATLSMQYYALHAFRRSPWIQFSISISRHPMARGPRDTCLGNDHSAIRK
jgi:hypothetical protein